MLPSLTRLTVAVIVVGLLASCTTGQTEEQEEGVGYRVTGASSNGAIALSGLKCDGPGGAWELTGVQTPESANYSVKLVVQLDPEALAGDFSGRAAFDGGTRIERGSAELSLDDESGVLHLSAPDPATPLGGDYLVAREAGLCPM